MQIPLPGFINSVVVFFVFLCSVGHATELGESPSQLLDLFSRKWQESDWTAKSKSRPQGYLRPLDDAGWRLRMQTMHGLVSHGSRSIEPLLVALKSNNEAVRILSAQTLGYLSDVPREPLLKAVKEDRSAAVRLYAVDALGMQGNAGDIDWQSLRKAEQNNDVRKHIGYAIERNNAGIKLPVANRLRTWNPQTLDSAVVGKRAPDFQLDSVTGENVRLSDYQGKKNVVLVFIYGDT